jgi:lipoprotein-anchoring transpeptidase ErfK/SrfK
MGSRFIRRFCLPVMACALVVTTAAACSSGAKIVGADGADTASKESAAKVSVTPEADKKDVPVSAEIGIEVDKGELSEVAVVNDKGDAVKGDMRDDGSSWVPKEPLAYDTTYTATVTAVDKDKIEAKSETKFTTMAEPSNRAYASLWNHKDVEYGQAMPVMINFNDFEVPEDQREAVERRLFVTSDPVQPGAWHWFSATHLEYRPKDFWEPGTKIDIRLGLGGLPMGGDIYGGEDVTSSMQISGTEKVVEVSNENKEMVAKENGETTKSMPVSLGREDKPSYSGTMIVMEKEEKTTFSTMSEPECKGKKKDETQDCYETKVEFAQRLTWSGQYIHAAPWSVADQGKRNVSHGCVNVSDENAEWIYNFTDLGTPVIITGTGVDLPYGDGYTAFGMSWEKFLEGSYLPPPDEKQKSDDKD